jgi:hypothetical protein
MIVFLSGAMIDRPPLKPTGMVSPITHLLLRVVFDDDGQGALCF